MSDVNTRAKSGIKLLMGRQVLLQLLTFGGGVLLARVLEPAQFGLYAIATFLVSAFAMFGDFGLAASFIQRKREVTEQDLCVGFTVQQAVTTIIVFALFVSAPWLIRLYPNAPLETTWLIRALALNLYLSSWRTMSALQLERQLQYSKLARVEIVETLIYQGLAVGLALLGFGIWSFVCATLARGLLGAALVYMAAPWRIRLRYDKVVVKDILRFGLPFQLQQIINSVGNWVTPLMVGSIIGPQAVGLLTWASSNGKKPLVLADSIMRVAFPHFARIQDDRAEVDRILVRYLTFLFIICGLWSSILIVDGSSLVTWIYTAKWSRAVPALVIFSVAMFPDVLSWILTVTLNSLGLVAFATRVYVVRSITNIVLGVLLVLVMGFNGVPVAYLISVNVTGIWLMRGLGQGSIRRILAPLAWLIIPIACSILAGEGVARLYSASHFHTILTALFTSFVYCTFIWITGPETLRTSVRSKLSSRRPVVCPPELSSG